MDYSVAIPEGVPTRVVELGSGAIDRLPQVLARIGVIPPSRAVVVQDARTGPAAGNRALAVMASAGYRVRTCQMADDAHGLVPGEATQADQIVHACEGDTKLIVGVGAGVVNDLAKLASHRTGAAYVAVATAASMNGYGSPISAVVDAGVKVTLPSAPTLAIVADLDVLTKAPLAMTRSGFADLLSKLSATTDWKLASLVRSEPFDPRSAALLDPVVQECERQAGAIGRGEPDGIALLMQGLIAGAFAMTLAGHSSPASGGEHLLSHLWDMQNTAAGVRHHLHGFQVALGMRVTSVLHQRLLALPADAIDPDRGASGWRPWAQRRERLRATHGKIFEALEPQARKQFLEKDQLRAELDHVRKNWDAIRAAIAPLAMAPRRLLAAHRAAGVPLDPAAVGQNRESVRHALLHAKDVRARFTVLHLVSELGLLEPWSDGVLDEAGIV